MQESRQPAVEYAERTDSGRDPDKQINEDACGYRATRFGHLCVVCDGMGGHAAGREAAELALATVFEWFQGAADETPPAQVLRQALEEANRRVHAMHTSEVALGRPGSTAVAVLLHPGGTEVAHVGDSRAYLVHEGQLFRLTRDHSIVQELVDRGLLTPQQAVHHPEANRITRALGMSAEAEIELRPQPVHHVTGDVFVLCSDGLSDLVEEQEILTVVGGEPAEQAVGRLVSLANARGGHDNITVVVLRAREPATVAATAVGPTLAQTAPEIGEHADPPGAPGATLFEPPLSRALEPTHPQEATPAPPSVRTARPRRGGAAVVVGLALAALAVALLVGVLVDQLSGRAGKRNAARWPAVLDVPVVDAGRDGATRLEPESVPVPAASGPGESIGPLELAPQPPKRRRR